MSLSSRGADEMRRVRSVGFLMKGIRCSYIVGFGNWFRVPNFDTIYVGARPLDVRGQWYVCGEALVEPKISVGRRDGF
jgi:hypothetical protein